MTATLAEQLGFEAQDRVAVVHVDDIGMCHSANLGGFEALANGPATCGSIMVPCPWFREAAEMARSQPDADLGVHLTLTSEYAHYRWGPVLGARVPSLLDAEGYLPRTTPEAGGGKPEEVEMELRAQIDRALDAGIDVTHLDSHMGTAFLPGLFAVYTKLALDYQLPIFLPRPDMKLLEERGLKDVVAPMMEIAKDYEDAGGAIFDHVDLYSLEFPDGEGLEWNRKRIAGLREGMNWLLCHASQGSDELTSITQDAHQREFERTFYGGEAGHRELQAANIKTIGMRPLRDLMRA